MRRAEAGIQVDKFYPPTDWLDNNNQKIDIRKNAENNSIVLLVGHSADFSKYSLLGLFVDTSSGTYDVYIDDVLVGSGITKNTQYDIDFSTINTSYGSATTPEALVLHKVVIKPTTSGEKVTTFRCTRTSDVTSTQYQGVLWCHFELQNNITVSDLIGTGSLGNQLYRNNNCLAVTSKGNIIKSQLTGGVVAFGSSLSFIPIIDYDFVSGNFYFAFVNNPRLKRIIIKNRTVQGDCAYFLYGANIEQFCCNNVNIIPTSCNYVANYDSKLKIIPKMNYVNLTGALDFLRRCTNLYPTKIDISKATGVTRFAFYGESTYPVRGFRGLKVSNEAPFSGGSPQINVAYTGLDRDALRELFTSLPYNVGYTEVGSPTISSGVVSGFSVGNYIRINNVESLDNKTNLEIKIKFNSSDFSNAQDILCCSVYGLLIRINNNGRILMALSSNGTSWDLGTLNSSLQLTTNTDYYLRFKYDGETYKLQISTDDVTYVDYITLNSALTLKFGNGTYFGVGAFFNGSTNTFNGSIDFNKTYIKFDDIYFFRGQAQMTKTLSLVGATGNNLTKVGSPTIDENGVASGFSESDYLRMSNINFKKEESFEFICHFKSSNVSQVASLITGYALIVQTRYSKLEVVLREGGSQKNISGKTTLINNNDYWVKIVYTTKKVEVYLSTNGEDYSLEGSRDLEQDNSSNSTLTFMNSAYTVYLEDTLFKQNYNYTMKGYLLDTDKAIATDKGWGLVLS